MAQEFEDLKREVKFLRADVNLCINAQHVLMEQLGIGGKMAELKARHQRDVAAIRQESTPELPSSPDTDPHGGSDDD